MPNHHSNSLCHWLAHRILVFPYGPMLDHPQAESAIPNKPLSTVQIFQKNSVAHASMNLLNSQVIEEYKLGCHLILHLCSRAGTKVKHHWIMATISKVNQATSNLGNVLPYRCPLWLLMVDGPLTGTIQIRSRDTTSNLKRHLKSFKHFNSHLEP